MGEAKYDELLKRIVEEYGSLESECDFVVCLGTVFHDIPPGLTLDFNIDVANNLGALAVPVTTGYGQTPQDVIRRSSVLLSLLETKRCDVLALFVNRVAPERVDEILGLAAKGKTRVPIFVLPELGVLARPTVAEIAEELGATRWSGDPESFTRDVEDIKIGAMELPNFLDYLVEGTLVITPGDRSDIILGSLMADAARTYPRIAGVLFDRRLKACPAGAAHPRRVAQVAPPGPDRAGGHLCGRDTGLQGAREDAVAEPPKDGHCAGAHGKAHER